MSETGTIRTPTAVLEARGAFKKHPERRRPYEPLTGRGIGPPPEFFTDGEKQIWDRTIKNCAPGVFQSSDGDALMVYCLLMAELMPAEYSPAKGGWRRVQKTGRFGTVKPDILVKLWARFGMTPCDRPRVEVVPTKNNGNGANAPLTGLAKFTTPRVQDESE